MAVIIDAGAVWSARGLESSAEVAAAFQLGVGADWDVRAVSGRGAGQAWCVRAWVAGERAGAVRGAQASATNLFISISGLGEAAY